MGQANETTIRALSYCRSVRATVAELVVDAALSGDIDDMALAIHAEGAVTRPYQARALARELVQAQIEHLPQFQ